MPFFTLRRSTALLGALLMAFTMVASDHAEARRGGSFGSRGSRTFQSAPATRTAPERIAPIQRTTTPNAAPSTFNRQQTTAPGANRGLFGGGLFGGGLFRGLLIGGLFGMLLGHGFGGFAGGLSFLFQLLLIGGLIWLALRLFRSQPRQAPAYGGVARMNAGSDSGFAIPGIGSGQRQPAGQPPAQTEITLGQADLDTFERRLSEVQEAFGREDEAALRRLATPEMAGFLSEELADNARNGVRNEVSDVRLLQADIAESWRESGDEYATAALLYQSRDVTRDRQTGRVIEDQSGDLSETTELWTFTRRRGGNWLLSAIQEA